MNTPSTQARLIGLATLNLAPDSFTKELIAITKTDKLGWTADEHIKLVFDLLPHLKDETGNSPDLTEDQKDRLRLIYRPLEETQRKVLKQTFGEAGYKLTPEAEAIFVMMLSAGQFAAFLSKTDNPATKKPFITLEKKKGAKKKTLATLIGSAPTPPENPQIDTDADASSTSEAGDPKNEN